MLRATPSWGHCLFRELDKDRCAEHELTNEPWQTRRISVWVEAAASMDDAVLSVRFRGVEIARCDAKPFSLQFDWRCAEPGECFLAELEAAGQKKCLHILRPLEEGGISLSHLLLTPSVMWPREAGHAGRYSVADCGRRGAGGQSLRLPACAIDRGIGLEVELLTPAPDVTRQESLLKQKGSRQDAWSAACAASAAEEDAALIERCARWEAGEDVYILPSPAPVPRLMVEALEAQHPTGRLPPEERAALVGHSEWQCDSTRGKRSAYLGFYPLTPALVRGRVRVRARSDIRRRARRACQSRHAQDRVSRTATATRAQLPSRWRRRDRVLRAHSAAHGADCGRLALSELLLGDFVARARQCAQRGGGRHAAQCEGDPRGMARVGRV